MMDHYGRVWTIRMATVNILITGFATPFVNGFIMFAVFRFLMGLSYPTFFICTFLLSKLYMNTLVIYNMIYPFIWSFNNYYDQFNPSLKPRTSAFFPLRSHTIVKTIPHNDNKENILCFILSNSIGICFN